MCLPTAIASFFGTSQQGTLCTGPTTGMHTGLKEAGTSHVVEGCIMKVRSRLITLKLQSGLIAAWCLPSSGFCKYTHSRRACSRWMVHRLHPASILASITLLIWRRQRKLYQKYGRPNASSCNESISTKMLSCKTC